MNTTSKSPGLLRYWQRIRRNWGTTLIFSLISTLVCGILVDIIDLRNFFDKHNLVDSLYYTLASMFIYWSYAVIVLLMLRLSFERAAELVQRPGRYCKLLLIAALISSFVGTTARNQLEQHSFAPFSLPPYHYAYAFTQVLMWGGLMGWLYLLYLQRIEDRAMFSSLIGKRAMLARQLAHSELLAARAQIDPHLLVDVLRLVHKTYPQQPEVAAQLLDHLISYLRMAMNRKRETFITPEMEREMAYALAILHSAQQGGLPAVCEKLATAAASSS